MTTPDLVETIVNYFKSNFTQANVDSTRTTYINEQDEDKRVAVGNQDVILVYEPNTNTLSEVGVCRLHVDRNDYASIEFATTGSRTIKQKLQKEIERLIYAMFKFSGVTISPSGATYQALRPIGWTRLQGYVNFHRYVLEVEAISNWEPR